MAVGPGYTNAEGVYFFGESDNAGLISDTLNLLPTTLSTLAAANRVKFAKLQVSSYLWANVAARTAQTGMANGDEGYQSDTGVIYKRLGGAWKEWDSDWITYAPTLTGITLGTSPTTRYRYKWRQGICLVDYSIKLGTGGAFTAQPTMTLPITGIALDCPDQEYDGKSSAANSAGNIYPIAVLASSSSVTIAKFWTTTSGAYAAVSATVPHTWALGSVMRGKFEVVPA